MTAYTFYIYSASILVYNGTDAFDFGAGYDPAVHLLRVDVTDDDSTMDAFGDSTQVASIYDGNGNLIDSGPIEVPAYAELAVPGGGTAWIDRIEIDGIHYGYYPSDPLTPGTSYLVTNSATVPMEHTYYQSGTLAPPPPCFGPDTWIETADGPVQITALQCGDQVRTLDHGVQPLAWVGQWHWSPALGNPDDRRAVALPAPLGSDTPVFPDLLLSRQHRLLLWGPSVDLMFGHGEVLAPACGLPGALPTAQPPCWYHLLFERHEIIRANGVWVESLFTGDVLSTLQQDPRRARHMADLPQRIRHRETARPCLSRQEALALGGANLPLAS